MRRAADIIFGAIPVASATTAMVPTGSDQAPLNPQEKAFVADVAKREVAPGIGGAVAGAWLWKKHRVLGFFSGAAVGSGLYPLATGEPGRALVHMGVTGASVAGSLSWKKHPFWGFVLGGMAGSAISTFVPEKYKARKNLPSARFMK